MTKVTELVADVVTPLAEARGDELVDVEYVKEKKQYYLRIYVDRRPGGIDIEEIANLSELVSSPGLERPIKNEKDWERAKGSYIHVSLYQKIDGEKTYEGTLKDLNQNQIVLEVKIKTRRKEITIPRKVIASSRFAVEF